MGFLDDAIDKAKDLAEDHPDQVSAGLDKAEGLINEKTGGKFEDQLDGGVEKAKDALGIDE
ncbi:antitoxin [Nocardioides sp. DS6]|uniref:Antitoxin n=1 Tax=Nocardioides eburneus TaxID=3231482 RepID=A0ABV3T3Y6_9ACTN